MAMYRQLGVETEIPFYLPAAINCLIWFTARETLASVTRTFFSENAERWVRRLGASITLLSKGLARDNQCDGRYGGPPLSQAPPARERHRAVQR
jgi:hypothetical protein